jgi:redox-sensitive bicupin YhaK (pirin superfamily)
MCDNFAMASSGVAAHEDEFPVDWHPHRGMDLLSYIKSGVGRHGDSMGNRETFATPGMQWVSAGSGIEHAEGGGTPAGDTMKGFQIWINVPSTKKMDDPRYGTHPPSDIPLIDLGFGATARLLAGKLDDSPDYGARGPFQTAANVTMVDLELAPGAALNHSVPRGLDTALLYVYEGSAASINGAPVGPQSIVQFDAGDDEARGLDLVAGGKGLAAMLFAGKRLNEPIAWHGPIVMNTQAELRQCFSELRAGTFPPIKVEWPGRGGYKIAANGRKAASAGAAAAT